LQRLGGVPELSLSSQWLFNAYWGRMNYLDLAFSLVMVGLGIAAVAHLRTRPSDLIAVRRLAEERNLSIQSIRRTSVWPILGFRSPYVLSGMSRVFIVTAISPDGERRKLVMGIDPIGTSGTMQVFKEESVGST
jgi:hypothetical protein